jgi:DNA-binding phage protein
MASTGLKLGTIARLNNLTVVALAATIRRSRFQLYRAWEFPNQHKPTYQAMKKLLPITEVHRGK